MRSALEVGGAAVVSSRRPEVVVRGLGRLFEDRVSMTSSRDLAGLSDVRRRALMSVRVAVTVAVNQVPGRGPARFLSMKVQVNDLLP
jgi:hypothetical protein